MIKSEFLKSPGPHGRSLSMTHLSAALTPSHSTLSNYLKVQLWAFAHTAPCTHTAPCMQSSSLCPLPSS